VFEEFKTTGEQAGNVGANAHQVLANGLGVQHVVKTCGTTNFCRAHAAEFSDRKHPRFAQVSVLLLH
jgi:hypothetical protein